MGLKGVNTKQVANQPSQVRAPVKVDPKMGRNQKITVQGPDGEKVEPKWKAEMAAFTKIKRRETKDSEAVVNMWDIFYYENLYKKY